MGGGSGAGAVEGEAEGGESARIWVTAPGDASYDVFSCFVLFCFAAIFSRKRVWLVRRMPIAEPSCQ